MKVIFFNKIINYNNNIIIIIIKKKKLQVLQVKVFIKIVRKRNILNKRKKFNSI